MAGLLSRSRIVAQPGFNRWLVPPAALAIHLCIGMAYGFSVFWLPLSRAIGISKAVPCPADATFFTTIFSTTCDWKISMLGWMFTLFFVFLGLSTALFGGWLEHAGPRKAGVVSALCWCGGLVISALGIYMHQIWLMWLGSGVIGGIGLGLGYISPVSTLIKWFPDRRGMATGMAIMGFGGGAMIGAPLADRLMKHIATATSVGVWETFLALAAIYFVYHFANNGFGLTLNLVIGMFLFAGLLLHGSPERYGRAIQESVGGISGIIIQFPFYAGIMGMMIGANAEGETLGKLISDLFIAWSSAETFPLLTFLSAGLLNMFIPSGGGQWAVQGPIMLPAGEVLGVAPEITAMAIAWGDAWTNMIQPFWALPLLAIAGLGARDIMGYCLIMLLYSGVVIGGAFYFLV